MLDLLADSMFVPDEKRTAFLGRFQHLQRLGLVEGINPGRGKAAKYQSHQILVIAIALQMLQLGLTPERTVLIISENQDRIRLAIGLAVSGDRPISPSMLWFDPSILTQTMDIVGDLAEATFDYGGAGTGRDAFERFFIEGHAPRMTFISVSGTLWHIVGILELVETRWEKPKITDASDGFLTSLREWFAQSEPDSLT